MRTVGFAPYNRPFDNNRFDPVTCRSLSRERSPRRVENGTAAIRCTDRGSGSLFTSCPQQLRPNRDCLTASPADRKSVVSGKSVSVRVDLGGLRFMKQKKKNEKKK